MQSSLIKKIHAWFFVLSSKLLVINQVPEKNFLVKNKNIKNYLYWIDQLCPTCSPLEGFHCSVS